MGRKILFITTDQMRFDALGVNEVLATWAMLAPRRMSRVPRHFVFQHLHS